MRYLYCFTVCALLFLKSYGQEKNNKHYIFSEFTKGSVLMKDGTIYDRFLNYNSLTEEMLFKNKSQIMAMSVQDMVDTVYVSKRKFFRLNNDFFELIYKSRVELYVERKCKVVEQGAEGGYGQKSTNTAVHSVSNYRGNNIYHKLNLPNELKTNPYKYYWLKKGENVSRFNKLRQLLKLYPNKKAIFKKYIKEHSVKYRDEESVVGLIKFLEIN